MWDQWDFNYRMRNEIVYQIWLTEVAFRSPTTEKPVALIFQINKYCQFQKWLLKWEGNRRSWEKATGSRAEK